MKPKPMEGYFEDLDKGSVKSAVTNLSQQAARIGTAASDAVAEAIEDGKVAARRAVKRGYNRAEDLIDEAAHRVKRSPLESVAVGFCAGLLVGAIFTRLIRR